ncbi:helix-turn-helix transcriptional regulator [Collimonas sp.]|uniref:helix-turn-helix transcriptional regulator n=1 Tax=Collimonas sp. TaxID=1963772 RepID=UPI002C6C9039|nr:helix-turn-helix domain-containing protein [Collimonas sp.]HWW99513.1 helix-turn-helix domain-containing protein [Collimonas sp.]
MMINKPLLTAAESAEYLSIGVSTLWRYVKENIAPRPVKIGAATRWRRSDLDEHIAHLSNRTTTAS